MKRTFLISLTLVVSVLLFAATWTKIQPRANASAAPMGVVALGADSGVGTDNFGYTLATSDACQDAVINARSGVVAAVNRVRIADAAVDGEVVLCFNHSTAGGDRFIVPLSTRAISAAKIALSKPDLQNTGEQTCDAVGRTVGTYPGAVLIARDVAYAVRVPLRGTCQSPTLLTEIGAILGQAGEALQLS